MTVVKPKTISCRVQRFISVLFIAAINYYQFFNKVNYNYFLFHHMCGKVAFCSQAAIFNVNFEFIERHVQHLLVAFN